MTHRSLRILDRAITPGTSVQLSMDIAKLPTHTRVEVPVLIHRAEQEGPIVLLLAGMHGDEINGIEIVRSMIRHNDHQPQRGTIICVPIANTFGFINQSRTVPDGRDLNRTFPGSAQGSLASRLAHTLLHEIVKPVDYILDFHTGGASRANHPQVRVALADERSMNLARVFDAPFIVASNYLDKSLRKTARRYDKVMLLYEGGESLRLDASVVQAGLVGTRRVLHHLGMRDESIPAEQPTVLLKKSAWVRAKTSGLFRAAVGNGTLVKKNSVLGVIADPYGESERSVKAPAEGYVICINHHPLVHQGEALIHLGYPG